MKLSIIVPCYNVAPYLGRGLLSLTNQTLTDIEIICIDDCSTDDTLFMLKEIAKHDLRIRVVENEQNRGVGYTRNRGIDLARGEFIGFMDPDDWVDADFFQRLIHMAEKTQTPVVCGDVQEHAINGSTRIIARDMKTSWHNFRYHYSAVYLRDFLNRFCISYPDSPIGEDSVFESLVKINTPKPILHVPHVRYHYCRRSDSLDGVLWSDTKVRKYIEMLDKIFDIYNMVDGMTYKDYEAGVFWYFRCLCISVFFKNINTQNLVATSLCKLFRKMRFSDKIAVENNALFLALMNNDPIGVSAVLKAQKYHYKQYRLFGKIKIADVLYNMTQRSVSVLGIKLWTSDIS